MKLLVIVTAALVLSGRPARAQDSIVTVHNGFLTANDYLAYSESYQRVYVEGIVDGMLLAPLFGAKDERVTWLANCLTGMTVEQIRAIVDKYLQANPVQWNENLHALVYRALLLACKEKG